MGDVMSAQLTIPSASVSWTPTDDGLVVVLDLDASSYLSLNVSGSELWRRLADGATVDELVSALVTRFGIERDRADVDVQTFLQSLRDRGLLVE